MEISILVAAAVAVASIASFFYVKSVRSSADSSGDAATDTINRISESANSYARAIPTGP